MFRKRQRLKISPAFAVYLPRLDTTETGEVSVLYRDESSYKLPDVETTRLRTLLESGVDIKQVNTKLFKATEINVELRGEQVNNNEGVNNNAE